MYCLLFLVFVPLLTECAHKCRYPQAEEGDKITEGCLQRVCKGGVWRTSLVRSSCCYERVAYPVNTTIISTMSEDQCVRATVKCVQGEHDNVKVVMKVENNCADYATKDQMNDIKDLLVKKNMNTKCQAGIYPATTMTMQNNSVSLKWEPCKGKPCKTIKNPAPSQFVFEMTNCTLDCPQLQDLMRAQAYMGIVVTYEKMICGQLGVEHCKVRPRGIGQNKIELVGVKTMLRGNEQCGAEISFITKTDNKILGLQQYCDLSCHVRTNIVQQCGTK